jgi:hypothetical protein
MRKLTWVGVGAILIIAVASFGLWKADLLPGRSATDASEEPRPIGSDVISEDAGLASPVPRLVGTGNASQNEKLKSYLCDNRVDPSCASSLVGAASIPEAAWLLKNGYPSAQQLKDVDYQSANLAELERQAKEGNLVAKGLLGRAYTNSGKPQEASAVLTEAITKGSVFAVYELSRVYASDDFQSHDINESAAYVRATYLLGDSRIAKNFYQSYPRFTGVEFAMADRRGSEIYQGLLKLRIKNGIRTMSPRPI